MKRRLISIVLAAAAILVAGCTKDDFYDNYSDVTDITGKGYLAEVTDSSYFRDADEFKSYVSTTISDMLDNEALATMAMNILSKESLKELKDKMNIEQGGVGEVSMRFEKYNFTYRSRDAQGNPVYLSGAVIFPNSGKEFARHEIDDITLFHPYWLMRDQNVTESGSPVMLRSAFNQMVVIPDQQGLGATKDLYHPFLEYFSLARQSIDCELAAIELAGKCGLSFRDGYTTYNMGMSKGAPVAMATLKMVENTEPEAIRKKLNIRSTYCCSGPYDLLGLLEAYNSRGNGTNFWMAAMIASSAYRSNTARFEGYEIEDFFTDEFNNAVLDDGERTYHLLDLIEELLVGERRMNEIFTAFGLNGIRRIFNARFFNEDGSFNYSDPLFKTFSEILESNNTAKGWDPQSELLIEHSSADDFVDYEVSMDSFRELNLSSGGVDNPLVNEHSYKLLDHNTISALSIVRMMAMKDPCSKEKTNY